MRTNRIERRARLDGRDRFIVGSSHVMSQLFLLGIFLPGSVLAGAPMPLWLAVPITGLTFALAMGFLFRNVEIRSWENAKAWIKANPHLACRLKEVLAQAAKDPEGVGFFVCALRLIVRDPDRITLVEGLYYQTANKAQLRYALCRERFEGLGPELTWAWDAQIRLAHHANLQVLLGGLYGVATVAYLAGGILAWHRTATGMFFSPGLHTFFGKVLVVLPAIAGILTLIGKFLPAPRRDE